MASPVDWDVGASTEEDCGSVSCRETRLQVETRQKQFYEPQLGHVSLHIWALTAVMMPPSLVWC